MAKNDLVKLIIWNDKIITIMPMQILIIIFVYFSSPIKKKENTVIPSLSFVILAYRIKLLMCKFEELRVLISII